MAREISGVSFQAEDGIRDVAVTGVQTCALPIFLLWSGSFWFAFMLYFFLFIILIDITRLFNHFFNIYPAFISANYSLAKFVAFLTAIIIIIGFINTKNIKINYAEIDIPKKSSNMNGLNLVLVADFHMTPINN